MTCEQWRVIKIIGLLPEIEMKSYAHARPKVTAIIVMYVTNNPLVLLHISEAEFLKIDVALLFIFENIMSSLFLLNVMV
jgi:hypothetical protein